MLFRSVSQSRYSTCFPVTILNVFPSHDTQRVSQSRYSTCFPVTILKREMSKQSKKKKANRRGSRGGYHPLPQRFKVALMSTTDGTLQLVPEQLRMHTSMCQMRTHLVHCLLPLKALEYRDWETGFPVRYRDWETVSQPRCFPVTKRFPVTIARPIS